MAVCPDLLKLHDRVAATILDFHTREVACEKANYQRTAARHSGAVDALRNIRDLVEQQMNEALARRCGHGPETDCKFCTGVKSW